MLKNAPLYTNTESDALFKMSSGTSFGQKLHLPMHTPHRSKLVSRVRLHRSHSSIIACRLPVLDTLCCELTCRVSQREIDSVCRHKSPQFQGNTDHQMTWSSYRGNYQYTCKKSEDRKHLSSCNCLPGHAAVLRRKIIRGRFCFIAECKPAGGG